MNINELIFKINEFGYNDSKIHERIEIYKKILQEQNKVFNLTRLDNDNDIYEKYFYESIEPFLNQDLKNKSILDIGSGSGIPGIVLKIIEPSVSLSILESNNKRVNFMTKLCEALDFHNVSFYCQRAEENWKPLKEKFDIVTSRAVSNIGSLLEISCQYAKIDGLIIEPKSHNYKNEYKKVSNKLNQYGLILNNIDIYKNTTCLIFKKVSSVDENFPRLWKDIVKEYK